MPELTGTNEREHGRQEPVDRIDRPASPDWKWTALFHAPEGFEREWRAWLGAAVHEEDLSLLRWWGQRADQAA